MIGGPGSFEQSRALVGGERGVELLFLLVLVILLGRLVLAQLFLRLQPLFTLWELS